MAPGGDIQRRRQRCLELAVQSGGDPTDIVNRAREFEGYLTDPDEVRSPDVEELIAAAQDALVMEDGWALRLTAALQQLRVDA